MPTDPTPFLATVVGTSVTLAAIVGGLLVARFVTIDSDQQTSRKVLTDARERLDAARGRMSAAWEAVLDWEADDFFWSARIAKAIDDGVTAPQELMRIEDWARSEDELRPYAEQAVREHSAARDILPSLVTKPGEDWDEFHRHTTALPSIRWPRLWEHVYDQIVLERVAEAEARARAASRGRASRLLTTVSLDSRGPTLRSSNGSSLTRLRSRRSAGGIPPGTSSWAWGA